MVFHPYSRDFFLSNDEKNMNKFVTVQHCNYDIDNDGTTIFH